MSFGILFPFRAGNIQRFEQTRHQIVGQAAAGLLLDDPADQIGAGITVHEYASRTVGEGGGQDIGGPVRLF